MSGCGGLLVHAAPTAEEGVNTAVAIRMQAGAANEGCAMSWSLVCVRGAHCQWR